MAPFLSQNQKQLEHLLSDGSLKTFEVFMQVVRIYALYNRKVCKKLKSDWFICGLGSEEIKSTYELVRTTPNVRPTLTWFE